MAFSTIAADKIRAEGWDYPTMLLRHCSDIAGKSLGALQKSQTDTQYNLLNLQNGILALDALLNSEPVDPPIPLNVAWLNAGSPVENAKYFEALMAWLRKICSSFDKYGIKPYITVEEGLDEDL